MPSVGLQFLNCFQSDYSQLVLYDKGNSVYKAKSKGQLVDLLGTLYFGMLSGKLVTINEVQREHMPHQARLVEVVGEALMETNK